MAHQNTILNKKAWLFSGFLALLVVFSQFQYVRLLQSLTEVPWDLHGLYVENQQQRGPAFLSVSGATGALYTMMRIRTYVDTGRTPQKDTWKAPLTDHHTGANFPMSEAWAVITTINPPTKTLELLAEIPGLRLCVVADRKSPEDYLLPGAVYLTPDMQEHLPYATLRHVPWNHFGRKNIGFLFAIHHGAKVIYDTDDDNEIDASNVSTFTQWLNQTGPVINRFFRAPGSSGSPSATPSSSINPYPYFGAPNTWPRGLPLEDIRPLASTPLDVVAGSATPLGIVQSLANHDPDVDALYRLSPLQLPFYFAASTDIVGLPPASSASGMAPYNAQATLHFQEAFWGMLLPVTVHGRVSDIWRSYFTQALLPDLDLAVAFSAPWVSQFRNAHNYLADFNAELQLYERSSSLTAYLGQEWRCNVQPFELSRCFNQLYVDMYEHGIVELMDVELAKAWIQDLHAIGYPFPDAAGRRRQDKNSAKAKTIGRATAATSPPSTPVVSVFKIEDFVATSSAGGTLRLEIPQRATRVNFLATCQQQPASAVFHREKGRSDGPVVTLPVQVEGAGKTDASTIFSMKLASMFLGDTYWITLSCGNEIELLLEHPVLPLATFDDVMLIVHFNRGDYQYLPDVLEMQGGADAFPHYIAVGSHKAPPGQAAPDGPIHSRQEFNGGWGMHRTVEYAMKTFPHFRGYLLMNNDVAMKIWKLGRLDRDKIWFHTDLDYGCGPKYTDPLREPLWERKWWWKDEKDTHFWQQYFMPTLNESMKGRAFDTDCGPDRLYSAGSDFFYVPSTFRSDYLELLGSVNDTLLAHQMEMFVPLVLRLLAPESDWERLNILHCVGPRRQRCPTIFAENTTVDVLHPWKYGAETESHPYQKLVGKKVWISP